MPFLRGTSSALLRRSASQAALNGGRADDASAAAADAAAGSPPARRPAAGAPARRWLVRCMLLLHTALMAALLLAAGSSITAQKQRGRELAQRLLADSVSAAEADHFGSPQPLNGTAMQQCADALELPQVRQGCARLHGRSATLQMVPVACIPTPACSPRLPPSLHPTGGAPVSGQGTLPPRDPLAPLVPVSRWAAARRRSCRQSVQRRRQQHGTAAGHAGLWQRRGCAPRVSSPGSRWQRAEGQGAA